MDIMDFESADDVLILVGIIAALFGQVVIGVILIVVGILLMRAKGESGEKPGPVNKDDYKRIDTSGDDDDGDDGDGDGDGDGDD
jgi:hypothetical protein